MSTLARNDYSRNQIFTEGNKRYKNRQFGVTTSRETVPVQLITLSPGGRYCGSPSTLSFRSVPPSRLITDLPTDMRTGNMPTNLMKTGAFVELKGSKYQSQSLYLGRGDILVNLT